MGHYIIYINLTSLYAREIDETSKWGGVRHFRDVPCYRKLRRYFNKIPLTVRLPSEIFLI